MKYTMKVGTLYQNQQKVAQIKSVFPGMKKTVFLADGTYALQTDIRKNRTLPEKEGDVRYRSYVMLDQTGKEYALANPGYAVGDDPEVVGWPIFRMPKVDHAQLSLHNIAYCLVMQNNQTYALKDSGGKDVMCFCRRYGLGRWHIEADDHFSPEIVCGIFLFCRYMEEENELLVL